MRRDLVIMSIMLALSLCLVVTGLAWPANTTLYADGTLKITPDGSTDWTWKSGMEDGGVSPAGIIVYSIQFNPSAANDILILHNGGVDAVEVFNSGPAAGTAPIIKYFPGGKRIKLVLDASDCTFDTAASAAIFVEYE